MRSGRGHQVLCPSETCQGIARFCGSWYKQGSRRRARPPGEREMFGCAKPRDVFGVALAWPDRAPVDAALLHFVWSRTMPVEQPLSGQRYLTFVDDAYEDLELWYPRLRLLEAGARVTVAGPAAAAASTTASTAIRAVPTPRSADMRAADFQGVVLPGGFMPDKLRRDESVLKLRARVRRGAVNSWPRFVTAAGSPFPPACIGACGPPVLPGIKDDLVNAGAIWEDAAVVVDRHFISSRKPDDLPDFLRAFWRLPPAGNRSGPCRRAGSRRTSGEIAGPKRGAPSGPRVRILKTVWSSEKRWI